MVDKLYVCRTCSYVFPEELSQLIEDRVQVYCEMCGAPFSLTGVEFRKATVSYKHGKHLTRETSIPTSRNKLSKAIQIMNKIDTIPLLIFLIISMGLSFTHFLNPVNGIFLFTGQFLLCLSGILIIIYESRFISPRIEAESYSVIVLDSLIYGILGSVIFGTGVLIIVKGILILIYVLVYDLEKEHRFYNFTLKLKNSLNNFSSKAGYIIVCQVLFLLFFNMFNNNFATMIFNYLGNAISITEPWSTIVNLSIVIIAFSLFPIIILSIDYRLQRDIYDKEIKIGPTIGIFILGAIGTTFFNVGIFIFIKAILMFFLLAGKPLEVQKSESKEVPIQPINVISETKPEYKPLERTPEVIKPEETEQDKEVKEEEPPVIDISEEKVIEAQEQEPLEPLEKPIEEETKAPKEKDFEFKLHKSLLPVKDEKDKKVVKEYFSKIFTILSKDLKEQITEIDIPKKEKKEILQELAFLTEEEQQKYIEGLRDLYMEFPQKLVERIKNLPNVKPQHYDKIIEQLRFMDMDEQLNYIQFLEKNA